MIETMRQQSAGVNVTLPAEPGNWLNWHSDAQWFSGWPTAFVADQV